jgi:chromosome segregation ATPase
MACTVIALVAAGLASADDRVELAVAEQVKTEKAAQISETRVAELSDQADTMLAEYRQAVAEMQSLKVYHDQLETQVQWQRQEIGDITRQLDEIETTSREVLPMMQKMVTTLEQFVALDVPFLPEERARRIAELKQLMARGDVSISEKYRRILEAYQIEAEYGRTLEAYQGRVGEKTVDFLRAGRTALMYQTLDGRETGYWDATARKWVVDKDYQGAMEEALKVAKKQTAPDFVEIAIPAAQEAR